jgi:hypothetical protein
VGRELYHCRGRQARDNYGVGRALARDQAGGDSGESEEEGIITFQRTSCGQEWKQGQRCFSEPAVETEVVERRQARGLGETD